MADTERRDPRSVCGTCGDLTVFGPTRQDPVPTCGKCYRASIPASTLAEPQCARCWAHPAGEYDLCDACRAEVADRG